MLDLFGQVVVTYEDIEVWVSALAPGFAGNPARLAHYVRAWDVPAKVARAKLDGTFDATIENARARRAFLARRFGMHTTP
ncbi:hypothetical protein [Paraburkholderia kururiensis]|uniref:hypothetical protein n=1 Tax=Paraburkholderia kururiensis TaxID=984307 RepID=UPI0005A7F0C9|nr:hypothetical protein [Paraburkholderia kururiensis]